MKLVRFLQRRKLFRALAFCVILWLLLVLYTYTSLDIALENVWSGLLRQNLDDSKLKDMMSGSRYENGIVPNALADIVLQKENMLNFFYLPKRNYETSFTEITSANRDTGAPLAPDFTIHINYTESQVVLYEDQGPGCVYRIYPFPYLPTDADKLHRVTSEDLKQSFIMLHIDGRQFWFSLKLLMDGDQWPFLFPVNTRHPKPASGMGAYTPFCYQKSMIISYHPQDRLPQNLFKEAVNCSLNNLFCPVHIYSGISRHKFPMGMLVDSFANEISVIKMDHKKAMESAAVMLTKPELHGPDSGDSCMLSCVEVCNGCRRMLFKTDQPGVITAIKFRAYDITLATLLKDWTQILITFQFDNSINPQLDRIPLGSLLGVSGSLNEFRGATMGHMARKCSHSGTVFDLPKYCMTGYFYFPMPYWETAVVYVEGAENLEVSQLLCFQFTTTYNHYDEATTGYFHAYKTYYTDKSDGVRKLLSLSGTWGNIVGVVTEVDNLFANRQVSAAQRWGLLQADHVLYVDRAKAATMLGTGLEDYFSYAHGFAMAENTSYAFVGVHHSAPRRKEPLTWHCYRLHILDPIPFHDAVDFIMEGTESKNFSPEQAITYEEHWNRRANEQSVFSNMVLYYARGSSGLLISDSIHLSNKTSEFEKHYSLTSSKKGESGLEFSIEKKRYLGQLLTDHTHNKKGRSFGPGDVIRFELKIDREVNRGAILRREFYSLKEEWNQRANVSIGGQDAGQWFIPMGTLSDEYILQEDDFPIHANFTTATTLDIQIVPLTQWCDIAYHLLLII